MPDLSFKECLKMVDPKQLPDLIYGNGLNTALGITALALEQIEAKMLQLNFVIFDTVDKIKNSDTDFEHNTENRLKCLQQYIQDIDLLDKMKEKMLSPDFEIDYIKNLAENPLKEMANKIEEIINSIELKRFSVSNIRDSYEDIKKTYREAIKQLHKPNVEKGNVLEFFREFDSIYTTNYDDYTTYEHLKKLHGSIENIDSIIVDTSKRKLQSISRNETLKPILEHFSTGKNDIFTLGISFLHDAHLVNVLKKSTRKRIFVGYYNNEEKSKLEEVFKGFCNNRVYFYQTNDVDLKNYQFEDTSNRYKIYFTNNQPHKVSSPSWNEARPWQILNIDKTGDITDRNKSLAINKNFNLAFYNEYNMDLAKPVSTADDITFIKVEIKNNGKSIKQPLAIVTEFRDFKLPDNYIKNLKKELQEIFEKHKPSDFHKLWEHISDEIKEKINTRSL